MNPLRTTLWLVPLCMALATSAYAQVEQQIVISEYNGKEEKTPLSEVNITVLNAASTITDAQGRATLRFRTFKAGDKVTIRRMDKPGYEIFNSMAIDQWNISPQRPFQIVLCRSDKFRALRDQYSRVASDSYARQYKAEQARLAAERKKTKMLEATYQQKMLDLENQYQQQLEDLENYVDQFARIDLSELNDKQQELIRLVQDGKIDKAIQKYESADYQALYQKQCEEIAKIDRAQAQLAMVEAQKRSEREKVFQSINRQIATYRLAGGRENFHKVTALLKSVADADTTQLEAVWAYAFHALNQRMVAECEKYINIYVRACKQQPILEANAWHSLGQNYMLQHELSKAEEAYTKALTIRQSLAEKDPERFNPMLLDTQINLNAYYQWIGNIEKSNEIGSVAVKTAELLYSEDKEVYQNHLSNIYCDHALTICELGDSVNALSMVEKACQLANEIYQKNTDNCDQYIWALTRKGLICYLQSKWELLVSCQKEYINVVEPLYKKNPKLAMLYMQSGYNNLADGYLHLQDYANCKVNLEKSEEFLNEMIRTDGDPHAYDRLNLYDIAVKLYHTLGDKEKTSHYQKEANEAFKLMAPEEQEQNREMLDSINNLK